MGGRKIKAKTHPHLPFLLGIKLPLFKRDREEGKGRERERRTRSEQASERGRGAQMRD